MFVIRYLDMHGRRSNNFSKTWTMGRRVQRTTSRYIMIHVYNVSSFLQHMEVLTTSMTDTLMSVDTLIRNTINYMKV